MTESLEWHWYYTESLHRHGQGTNRIGDSRNVHENENLRCPIDGNAYETYATEIYTLR